jgi:hypothetical protein
MWRALALVLLTACTAAAPGATPPTSPRPTPLPSPSPAGDAIFTRTCDSNVSGQLGAGWRRGEVVAGPVAFVGAAGYADDPPAWFSARGERATAQKVLLVVDGSVPVVLAVRQPDAALAYDPDRWSDRNVVPLRSGDRRVRFEPCGGDQPRTQFNGGFLVRGPGCVRVAVRVEGQPPRFATVSFGAGACTASGA